MEDRRSVIPPLSRPRLLGQPYHGLVRDGVLTLSNGKTVDAPWGWGDCYVLRVPGVAGQGVQMTPVEAAQEAAAGRQWLDYAMLVGRQRTYGGAITVGANAWLYAAPDGSVWRIECDRLDTTDIVPSYPVAPLRYGHYPATLDFTFKVQRFGVISPDDAETAPVSIRTIVGQSIGPMAGWQSDWFYDAPDRNQDKNRRFPGDGRQTQWMPINIDDINSKGSRVLFCVNRSIEQQMTSQPFGNGRAYPLAWIEVSVSGQTAENISISMSLVRMQLLDTPVRSGYIHNDLQIPSDTYPDISIGTVTRRPDLEVRPGETDTAEIISVSNMSAHGTVPGFSSSADVVEHAAGRCAGGYYDGSDVLCWVEAGAMTWTASNSQTYQISFSTALNVTLVPVYFDLATYSDGGWRNNYHCQFAYYRTVTEQQINQCETSCKIGPHTLTLPPLRIEGSSVTQDSSRAWHNFFGGMTLPDLPFVNEVSSHVVMHSVFGTHNASDNLRRLSWANGSIPVGALPRAESGGGVRHGVQLRPIDNVYLVRVTNKVYAVLADMDVEMVDGMGSGTMVVAVGTPQGWTMINALDKASINTAYNPVTGQLVTHPTQGVGWI